MTRDDVRAGGKGGQLLTLDIWPAVAGGVSRVWEGRAAPVVTSWRDGTLGRGGCRVLTPNPPNLSGTDVAVSEFDARYSVFKL